MKRLSPVLQVTLALTLLGCTVLLMAQWMWNVFPDPHVREAGWRQAHAESAAAQTLFMIERGLHEELQRTLDLASKADARIRSIGVRQASGALLAATREHVHIWQAPEGGRSTLTHVLVPIRAGESRWGQLEMVFEPERQGLLATLAHHPLAVAVAHFALLGGLLYWLYLRRAMTLLDPKAVIPERIRAAYDVMTEGVALLDARGRILMVNSAFGDLPGEKWPDVTGKKLSSLPWLAAGLAADTAQHPWEQTLRSGRPCIGHETRIGTDGARRLLVNCAAIHDESGRPRGCIVTFDDVSALQRANEQLTGTLAQLRASQREIERQNQELEHLASHDALSGCLSRRAGLARGQAALEAANSAGTPFSCLLVDIDRFKAINDSFGHGVGDDVVRSLGEAMREVLDAHDIGARHGGDEFIVLAPGRSAQSAHQLGERLRQAALRHATQRLDDGRTVSATVSIGVAAWNPATMNDLSALVSAADEALYEAKAQGRDCVRVNAAASPVPRRAGTIPEPG